MSICMKMERINSLTLLHLLSKNRNKMENAFTSIYNEYSYLVFYISFEIVKNKEVAKEIVNETFMKFYETREKIYKLSSLKSYLTSTCRNLSINYVKSNKETSEYNDEISGRDDVRDEFDDYIEKFSKFLNKEELDLIVYHYLYGYTFKEISNIKNVSINSISSKFKRALDKVKAYYKGENYVFEKEN